MNKRFPLLSAVLLSAGLATASPARAGGSFNPEPRNVADHHGFDHVVFEHRTFDDRSDFQSRHVALGAEDSFSDTGRNAFQQQRSAQFSNGLDSLSTSEDGDGKRFSQEAQEHFPNMRMRFEDASFQHLNFN
jgi:hypothetical protein